MQSKEMIKIIYLDIDGVLNSNNYFTRNPQHCERPDKYGYSFDPIGIKWLKHIIDKTGAKIVISSTWRLHERVGEHMKDMWRDRNMPGEVIDITDGAGGVICPINNKEDRHNLDVPRGCEIKYHYENKHSFYSWYKDIDTNDWHKDIPEACDLESYVILDDDGDMLYEQRNNFVQCDNMFGLREAEANKAINILNKEVCNDSKEKN